MKLLLIAPAAPELTHSKGKRVHTLSLAVIAALATPYFDDIRIVEEEFEPVDRNEHADLVGITMMTCQATRGYQLADDFRARGIPTICGGSHPSFMVEECGAHFDAVAVDEVESVWPLLMRDFMNGMLSPVYRGEQLFDLADTPIPRKDLFGSSPSTFNAQVLQATRGCPLGCDFCTVTQLYGGKFRARPVEQVVEEIRQFPSKIFFFVDDNIFFSRQYAHELFEALVPLGIKWGSQASLDLATRDKDLLRLAVRSGCSSLFVGIESLDQDTLDQSHKRFNKVAVYEQQIRTLQRHGVSVAGAFMFGFERDTKETWDRVYHFARRTGLMMLNTGILTPFPGTPFYERIVAEGRIVDRDWEHYTGSNLVWRHPALSKEDFDVLDVVFRRRVYSLRSIAWRLRANWRHPLLYLVMNYTHWWRAYIRDTPGRPASEVLSA